MLDVLMYLFESYVDSGAEFSPDPKTLETHLSDAGFKVDEIKRVFSWLEGLATLQASNQKHKPHGGHSIRVYNSQECRKLNVECRGFLMALEEADVLSPTTRELVINRAMSFEYQELNIEQLKWIIVFILFQKSGQKRALDLSQAVDSNKQHEMH